MCSVCQGRIGCPVCAPEPQYEICKECNGVGVIYHRDGDIRCDCCDGTGEIEIDEEN